MSESKKTIEVDCDPKFERHDFKAFEPMQGSLKSLSEENYHKLRKSILEEKFFMPFLIWDDKQRLRIMDGHGRRLILLEFEKEGYAIPKMPMIRIEAKTIKQAKKRLLLINSQFQKIERQGLYEFVELDFDRMEIDELIKDTELSDIDGVKFLDEFYNDAPVEPPSGAQEISSTRFETFTTKCPKCSFEFNAKRKPDGDDE